MTNLKYTIPKQFKYSTNDIYSGKIHWRTRIKIADFYHKLVQADCKQLIQYDKKVNISFKFYFKSRYLDSSNCSFMAKMLEDGLVKNGLFKDDNNKYIGKVSYESILIEPKERKKQEGDYVRIVISEI